MVPFRYMMAGAPDEALNEAGAEPKSAYLGGGTNLIDHLKLGVENPTKLVDVRKIGLERIEDLPNGGLRLGASATNTAAAYDERVLTRYPVLSQAILSGASPQLRNVATIAGNLLQGTRCFYFRDTASPCNKRNPGAGCSAIEGLNRAHAILGTSDQCIATHPSDMDVALMSLDAVVRTKSRTGEREIPIADFYVAYGEDPAKENVLQAGELVVSIDLPGIPWFKSSLYLKARDRASFEFALASAAVAIDLVDGRIEACRIALGGVATKPWRAYAAERALRNQSPTKEAFQAAADAELSQAKPQTQNSFKIELCRRILVGALEKVCGGRATPDKIGGA